MAAVRELAREKAVIVISHRLANVVGADQIYVLEKGRMAGCGTHEELLTDCAAYQRLWETQAELERFAAAGSEHTATPTAPTEGEVSANA